LAGVLQEVVATCATATHGLSLTAETVRISVHATSDQLTQGLARNTAPYLTPGPPAQQSASTAVVQVAVNNDLAGRLTNLAASVGPADSDLRHSQTFGRFHLAHKSTTRADGARSRAFVVWGDTAPDVTSVVLASIDTASERLLLRIVRAIATRVLLDSGWTPLHAACAVTPGGAICLVGGHSSGKTTALLGLLASGRGRTGFLANNAVFLMPGDDEMRIRGLPTAAAIRPPTLRMFPELATLTETSTPAGGLAGGSGAGRTDDRPALTPRQLAEAFSASLIPCTTLSALIAVNFDPQANGVPWQSRWKAATGAHARHLCQAACLTDWLADDPYELARLTADTHVLRQCHADVLDTVTRQVPCADFRTAPGTDAGDELLQVLAALQG
jgi:hypothetical protein